MNRLRAATVTATLLTVLVPVTAAEAAQRPDLTGASAAVAACTADTGPYQRQMERYLRRKADGRQSTADCEAIRRFQTKHKVRPANGSANLRTYRTMLVAQAGKKPNKAGKCPVRRYKVTCVDMNRQLLWLQRGRKVLFGPVPIRTGRDGLETRRGWHRVYRKHKNHFSSLYNRAPMPYAQFFDRGQALHGTPHDLYNGGGSAGCINLRLADAKRLWRLLKVRNWVYVWGTKPGTARAGQG